MVASFAAATIGVAACGNSGNGGGGSGGTGTTSSHAATTSSVVTTTSTTSGTGGMAACTEITLGSLRATAGGDGKASAFSATLTPDTGDTTDPDSFSLEFYGAGFDPMYDGDMTGSFDLGMGNDNNYATCSRCLSILQDPMTTGTSFFQKSGTLVVDASSMQIAGTFTGKLTDVTLVEVTIDSTTFESTPVPGGACLHITSATLTGAPPPAAWTCDWGYYGDGSCDCGCGVKDMDCADSKASSCDYCDDTGSCSSDACPGTINSTDNATCTAATDGGTDSGTDGGP